jgi:hypothetical protein
MNKASEQRSRQTREARADREIVGRLARLIAKAPKPRKSETPATWTRRHSAFVREWLSFCRENRTRLLRLDIDTNDIQILGIENVDATGHTTDSVPEPLDPKHCAAEEKEVLERLAKKPVKYQRLG